MTGPIKRHRVDPQSKGRGTGSYYHRGKGVFSKYSPARDRLIKAKNVPQSRHHYHHTGDVWAGVWRATKVGQRGDWHTALEMGMKELARITGYPQVELTTTPYVITKVGRKKGLFLGSYRRSTHQMRVAMSAKQRTRFGIEDLSTRYRSLEGWDPLRTLFHEWGHHIHFMSKQPQPPELSTYSQREAIADAYGRLYEMKIRPKRLAI